MECAITCIFTAAMLLSPNGFSADATAKPKSSSDVLTVAGVTKIWDAGQHNAFTDLIRFQGKWFCTFRESEAHVGGNGGIRVLTSADGKDWKSAALVTEQGIDLRDPKLSITPKNELMLVLGGSVYEGKTLKERQPRVAFSKDGHTWTAPQRILDKDDWLWRVTWHQGRAYGVSYFSKVGAKSTDEWTLRLAESSDGRNFTIVTNLAVPGHPNETTLRFLENGQCTALVRRETQDRQAWIGTSTPPYRDWKWHPAGMQIGGPNFIVLPDGRMLASGRRYDPAPGGPKTFVGPMTLDSVQSEITLPSGGDCSYPGMVLHEGQLWMTYYSSHEGQSAIYLARLNLKADK